MNVEPALYGVDGVEGVDGTLERSTPKVDLIVARSPRDAVAILLSPPYSCAAAGGFGYETYGGRKSSLV